MNLGELEFKAEDFPEGFPKFHPVTIADHLNRLLRERLEKAPIHEWYTYEKAKTLRKDWRARLVCIEELKR